MGESNTDDLTGSGYIGPVLTDVPPSDAVSAALAAASANDPYNTETAGGSRYSKGKLGGYWFAPLYGLRLVAEVWTAGAKKYAPRDWMCGQSFSSLIDCMSRHWLEVVTRGPWARDKDTGAYHLACLTWNALCLLTLMALDRRDCDDVSGWFGVNATEAKENGWAWPDTPPAKDSK